MTPDERFDVAFETLIRHEGGLADDPADDGGLTKYGITLGFLRAIGLPDGDVNGDGVIDERDIYDLDIPRAREIYRKHLWLRHRLNEIDNPVVATKAFEILVWMGYGDMATYLQEAICAAAGSPVIEIDGIAGSRTLAVLRTVDPGMVLVALRALACDHVRRQVIDDPTERRFLKGWTRRALA